MSYENRNNYHHRNNSMQEKMERIRPSLQTRHVHSDPYRNVSYWKEDGVDHINIYALGNTGIGQALAHASPIRFKHSVFGNFSSMESFWHYIQSEEQDDRIRNMIGRNLQEFSRKLTRKMVTNFRAIIMDSNYQRIIQNQKLAEEIVKSTLPFDCYYIDRYTGLRKRQNYFSWLIQGFEEIRKALIENRAPDFNSFKDVEGSDIYEFVRPVNTVVQDTEQPIKAFSLVAGFVKKNPPPQPKKPKVEGENQQHPGKKKKHKNKPDQEQVQSASLSQVSVTTINSDTSKNDVKMEETTESVTETPPMEPEQTTESVTETPPMEPEQTTESEDTTSVKDVVSSDSPTSVEEQVQLPVTSEPVVDL